MFFILMALNFVLYIATGMSYYKGNMKMAIIYGVIALILSLLTFNYYRNQRRKNKSRNNSGGDCGLSNCGGVDCFDMNLKDGFDCIDIQFGSIECFELDCGGADCGGVDCDCSP